jgi:hypothetical protein
MPKLRRCSKWLDASMLIGDLSLIAFLAEFAVQGYKDFHFMVMAYDHFETEYMKCVLIGGCHLLLHAS